MPKRIDKLTDEQAAQMPAWRDKWIAIGLSTARADRAKFEAAVVKCYAAAQLAPPKRVVWVASPPVLALAAPIAAYLLNKDGPVRVAVDRAVRVAVDRAVRDAVDRAVRVAVDRAVRDAVDGAVRITVDDAVGDAVDDAVGDAVDRAVRVAVDRAVRDAVGDAVDDAVGDAVRDAVGNAVRAAAGAAVRDAVGDAVRAAAGAAVRDAVGNAVRAAAGAAVRDAVGDAVDRAVRDAAGVSSFIRDNYYKYIGGQFWVGGWWGAPTFVSFFRDVCELELPTSIAEAGRAYQDTCESACWWWPHTDFVMVCERPTQINRDTQGRLHSATGPAIVWPDGWGVHSWHGTTVPAKWIEQGVALDPSEVLTHRNVEQRRAGAEIIGWKNILAKLNPRVIDKDYDPQIGTLLEVDLPDAPGERFLQVRCGTGRDFVLPVPREYNTALEANAATYNVPPQLLRQIEVRT